MSSKAPAFQFYPQDYLSSSRVAEMTLEEEGVYIRLLCYCWSCGSIPADPERCAKLAGKGCSVETATSVQRAFNEHPTDGQRLVHDRLEIERERQQIRRDQASEAGKKSAEKRTKQAENTAKHADSNGRSTVVQRKVNPSSSSSSSSSDISISYSETQTAIVVPKKMQTPEVQQAVSHWLTHLESKDPLKVPQADSPQMQALWHKWSSLGPERLVAAIWHSSSEGFITLHEPPAARAVGASHGKSKLRTPLDSIDWGDESESD
jgi:uncharacterized protein YdaU (DUF1376 family)